MKLLSALAALSLYTSAQATVVTADGSQPHSQIQSVSVAPGFAAETIDLSKSSTVVAETAPGSIPAAATPGGNVVPGTAITATPVPESMGAAVVAAVGFLLMLRRRVR